MEALRTFAILTSILALLPGFTSASGGSLSPSNNTYESALSYISELSESDDFPEVTIVQAESDIPGAPLLKVVIEDTGAPLLDAVINNTGVPFSEVLLTDDAVVNVIIADE